MNVTTAPVRGTELLFGGEVCDQDGAPITDAVLTACGSTVRTDAQGSFEVLAHGPVADRMRIVVAAAGHRPLTADIDLATARTARLTDGTIVVLHDFVLTPAGHVR